MLFQASIILFCSFFLAIICKFFRLPNFLAFLLTGFITKSFFNSQEINFEIFGKLGILLLLFCLGLEMTLNHFKALLPFLFPSISVITFVSLALFGVFFIKFSFLSALIIGFATTLSSTAIIVLFLKDNKEIHSDIGKFSITLLLVQDSVGIIVLLVLGNNKPINFFIGLLVFIIMILVLKQFINKILNYVYSKHNDIFLLSIITILFLIVSASHRVGLSEELGAFSAGVLLANSRLTIKIESYMELFKNLFLIFFFIEIGSAINLSIFVTNYSKILIYLFSIIFIKIFVTLFIGYFFVNLKIIYYIGFISCNVSESSFVILKKLFLNRWISAYELQIINIIFVLLMIISPFLIKLAKMFKGKSVISLHKQKKIDMIIYRNSFLTENIANKLIALNVSFVVIDNNIENIIELKDKNIPAMLGDLFSNENQVWFNNVKVILFMQYSPSVLKKIIALKLQNKNKNFIALTRDKRSFNLLTTNNINCINVPGSTLTKEIFSTINLSDQKLFDTLEEL